MKIQFRLTILLIAVSAGVVASAGIFTTLALDEYFNTRLAVELATQTRQVEYLLRTDRPDGPDPYQRLVDFSAAGNFRLTLISPSGEVVFDSDVPKHRIGAVGNHLARPEVQAALAGGTGTDTRHSATLGKDLFYLAARVNPPLPAESSFRDAAVLRLAIPLTHVREMQAEISSKIIITSILLLICVAVVAVVLSRRLARPITEIAEVAQKIQSGDLDQRIVVRSGDEFGRLAASLNGMVDTLNADITKLRKLEQIRSEFLGNVSHELRTPIFAIQGMLETLLNGALEDREVNRSFVESALRNTERLNTLLADLIDISSIESGEMKMSFRTFRIGAFLEGIISEMLPVATRKGISLELSADPADPDVLGDKERLRQVMVNLIDNAIKYSESGTTVVVEARSHGERMTISVSDSGVGIPAEDIPRIFERFYRVDKERSRDAGGTGLGLAIVKHIAEAHGGRVSVESAVGKGSVFSFSLKTT